MLRTPSLVLTVLIAGGLFGCSFSKPAPAPRPARSQSDRHAPRERSSGGGPVAAEEGPPEPTAAAAAPLPDLESVDRLLINGDPIELDDVLRAVRQELGDARRPAPEHAQRVVTQMIIAKVRNLLLYQEALREMDIDAASAGVERMVDQEIKERVGRDYGGRQTIFEEHLRKEGQTIEDVRGDVRQSVVVRRYLYERILQRIASPTRQQLWDYYQSHIDDYQHEASRELYLIQVSKKSDAAGARDRAAAALQRIRDGEPFEAVAREVSDGINRAKGGAWGAITSDLRGPYAPVSATLNELHQDQVSDLVEGSTAWFIVKAGIVADARTTAFTEVQDDLRERFRMDQLNAHQRRLLTMLQRRAIVEPDERLFVAAVLWQLQKEYEGR